MASSPRRYTTTTVTVAECFEKLKGYVDSSDPDITLPNLEHMLQTAEAMRAAGEPEWMQLIGTIQHRPRAQPAHSIERTERVNPTPCFSIPFTCFD